MPEDVSKTSQTQRHLTPDEWVKDTECTICGIKGNIARDCPDHQREHSHEA